MPPEAYRPRSSTCSPAFVAASPPRPFRSVSWLVAGFVAQPGTRTVGGMLSGARLAGAVQCSPLNSGAGSPGPGRRMKHEGRD